MCGLVKSRTVAKLEDSQGYARFLGTPQDCGSTVVGEILLLLGNAQLPWFV